MSKLDVNDHLVVVGNFGVYQWLVLILNGMLACLFGMQMFVTVFTHATPDFRCIQESVVSNSSVQYDNQCTLNSSTAEVTIDCERFEYDTSIFTATLATEFDAVCGAAQYVTMVNVAWMISEGVGSILGSYICDR
ncbi:uncharacterized protein [Watersipora subatra]|uniref:uncharacterized protein n=1 Tax=Watersipora subatra TaxID=2589382 RepID=UPI00355BEEF8